MALTVFVATNTGRSAATETATATATVGSAAAAAVAASARHRRRRANVIAVAPPSRGSASERVKVPAAISRPRTTATPATDRCRPLRSRTTSRARIVVSVSGIARASAISEVDAPIASGCTASTNPASAATACRTRTGAPAVHR